jgi:hypothetical protein
VSPPPSPSPGFAANGGSEHGQPDPPSSRSSPSFSSTLSSMGGEPLAGSGFEAQPVHRGFAPMSVTSERASGSQPSAALSATRGEGETAAPSNVTAQGVSGVESEVASIGSAGSANPQLPTPVNSKNPLTHAVDQVRGLRGRLRSLPSDAAPHATPPRIPIDHEE